MGNERKYDVVVYGATGFTGGLVCEYIASLKESERPRWAIAGRSAHKLTGVVNNIRFKSGKDLEVDTIVASSDDSTSLDKMCSSTKVVITTVGPYTLYGEPLVAACVRNGTSYVDITGETPWVREMIDKYEKEAIEKKIRIISCCGFDSIPAEIGTYMVAKHANEELNTKLKYVKSTASVKGSVSGGTIASMMVLSERTPMKTLSNKFLLNPPGPTPKTGPISEMVKSAYYDRDLECWVAPFVMALCNSHMIRRTQALLKDDENESYGDSFEYQETAEMPNRIAAYLGLLFMFVLSVCMKVSFLRNFLKLVLPKQGTGPSEETRAASKFRYRFFGLAEDGTQIKGEVSGGDPGYTETSKMLTESALSIALDEDKLPKRYGFLSPAAGLGSTLLARLRKAGIVCKVSS